MKKQILNIGKALSRAEQKEVFGGFTELSEEGDTPCSVYVTGTGWVAGYSVSDAQFLYSEGGEVTGYCCASC